jgi:hypothetical protein
MTAKREFTAEDFGTLAYGPGYAVQMEAARLANSLLPAILEAHKREILAGGVKVYWESGSFNPYMDVSEVKGGADTHEGFLVEVREIPK